MPRCRHTTSWLLAGARVEWCYGCGAIRLLRPVGASSHAANSIWQAPTGGENPWQQFDRRSAAMLARREREVLR